MTHLESHSQIRETSTCTKGYIQVLNLSNVTHVENHLHTRKRSKRTKERNQMVNCSHVTHVETHLQQLVPFEWKEANNT